eukprot:9097830-Alexandrium_andersonii.AAC.1
MRARHPLVNSFHNGPPQLTHGPWAIGEEATPYKPIGGTFKSTHRTAMGLGAPRTPTCAAT